MKSLRLSGLIISAAAVSVGCSQLAELGPVRRPLSYDEPIRADTRARLLHSTQDPLGCRVWLTLAGVGFTAVQDRSEGEFCQVSGAVTLSDDLGDATVRLSPRRPMMTCRLAAGMAVWRRQSVEPAAREILGAGVRQIDHLGVYACRRIYNQSEGRPSAHSRAEAIDVSGFRLTDGRQISVRKHWRMDTAEGRFLRRIRDDACRVFGVTLSPDYNAAHSDHLHLEFGFNGICA